MHNINKKPHTIIDTKILKNCTGLPFAESALRPSVLRRRGSETAPAS